jgi:ribonuclease P protein component
MLPAKYRLQLRRTLPFYLFPHKAHNADVSVYWHISEDGHSAQAAIVVPKKVARTAVLRNRTKRVLSAALVPLFPTLPPGLQCVVIVRKADVALRPKDVVNQITALWR